MSLLVAAAIALSITITLGLTWVLWRINAGMTASPDVAEVRPKEEER